MARFIIVTIAFVTISINAKSQNHINYDFLKAKEILTEEFFKGNFWTMPTNENDICYFQSKSEAKKIAEIRPIPVLKLVDISGTVRFEPDYSLYVAFLFKEHSFLCPLYVNTYSSRQGKISRYIAVGWNPPKDFIEHHVAHASSWFYSPLITDFVFSKDAKYYVWDEQNSSLKDYTENLIAAVQAKSQETFNLKFTGIDTMGMERITKYTMSTIQSDLNSIRLFQSNFDSVKIGPVIETEADSSDKMNRIAVSLGDEGYVIAIHPNKEWIEIETYDHRQIAMLVYAPYTNTPESQLAFNKFEGFAKRLVEMNVKIDSKKRINFTFSKSDETILIGQRVQRGKEDYFIIQERIQEVLNPKILALMAIVIFCSDTL